MNVTIFIIATVIMIVVCGLLLQSLLRSYRRPADSPETAQALSTHAALEALWTLLPIGLIVVLLILTYRAI